MAAVLSFMFFNSDSREMYHGYMHVLKRQATLDYIFVLVMDYESCHWQFPSKNHSFLAVSEFNTEINKYTPSEDGEDDDV